MPHSQHPALWWHSLLSPAAYLLGRLSYPRKFLLIGMVVLVPISAMLYLLSAQLDKKVSAIAEKQAGIEYAATLRTLLQILQQHRGMSVALLSGDASFRPRIEAKQREIHEAVKAIGMATGKLGNTPETTNRWTSLEARVQDITARVWRLTPEESIVEHTAVIGELISLFLRVIDMSGLTLDESLDSQRLQQAMYRRMPRLSEALGELRARGSAIAANGVAAEQHRARIMMLYGVALDQASETFGVYRASFDVNREVRAQLEKSVRRAEDGVGGFLASVESTFINDREGRPNAAAFFQAATTAIDDVYAAFDASVPVLGALLAAREEALVAQRNLSWGIAGLTLIAISWLFIAFSLIAVQSLGRMRSATRRILEGDYSARLVVSTRDELGDLAEGINDMSAQLMTHIDRLNAKSAALATQNTMIEASQRAITGISMSTGSLLSEVTLEKFASIAIDLLERILAAPAHCLFCVRDDEQNMSFVLAGSGRYACDAASTLAEFGDEQVRRRIMQGRAKEEDLSGRHWEIMEVSTAASDTVLIYVEDASQSPLAMDPAIKQLYLNQIKATYGYVANLGKIKKAHRAAILALADLAEFKDNETGEHVMRVAHMTDEITAVLREKNSFPGVITDQFVEQVGTASVLHDVGKVAIPDSILLKPGKLDAAEWDTMKTHALLGGQLLSRACRIAKESLYFSLASQVAEGHHEHYDGNGYPRGLRGEEIPLAARIVAVVDVCDALSSKRPYKEPWPTKKVLAYIKEKAGVQFDPLVVEAFQTVMYRRAEIHAFKWTGDMSVGDDCLDADHAKLIDILNSVAKAQMIGNQNSIGYALENLRSYTLDHFNREEQHMLSMGYPLIEEHKRLHDEFISRIGEIEWQYQRGLRSSLSEELLKFLMDWLRNHIRLADMQYHRYQLESASQAGMAPDKA